MYCSSSLLGYALESFVDVWSSILVLWRFWSEDSDKQESRSLYAKEKKASVGIAGMVGKCLCTSTEEPLTEMRGAHEQRP